MRLLDVEIQQSLKWKQVSLFQELITSPCSSDLPASNPLPKLKDTHLDNYSGSLTATLGPAAGYPFWHPLWFDVVFVDKLEPCYYRSSDSLEVWRLWLRLLSFSDLFTALLSWFEKCYITVYSKKYMLQVFNAWYYYDVFEELSWRSMSLVARMLTSYECRSLRLSSSFPTEQKLASRYYASVTLYHFMHGQTLQSRYSVIDTV